MFYKHTYIVNMTLYYAIYTCNQIAQELNAIIKAIIYNIERLQPL